MLTNNIFSRPKPNYVIVYEDLDIHQQSLHKFMRHQHTHTNPACMNAIFFDEYMKYCSNIDSTLNHQLIDHVSAITTIKLVRDLLDNTNQSQWHQRAIKSTLEGIVDVIFNVCHQHESIPTYHKKQLRNETLRIHNHYERFLFACCEYGKTSPLRTIVEFLLNACNEPRNSIESWKSQNNMQPNGANFSHVDPSNNGVNIPGQQLHIDPPYLPLNGVNFSRIAPPNNGVNIPGQYQHGINGSNYTIPRIYEINQHLMNRQKGKEINHTPPHTQPVIKQKEENKEPVIMNQSPAPIIDHQQAIDVSSSCSAEEIKNQSSGPAKNEQLTSLCVLSSFKFSFSTPNNAEVETLPIEKASIDSTEKHGSLSPIPHKNFIEASIEEICMKLSKLQLTDINKNYKTDNETKFLTPSTSDNCNEALQSTHPNYENESLQWLKVIELQLVKKIQHIILMKIFANKLPQSTWLISIEDRNLNFQKFRHDSRKFKVKNLSHSLFDENEMKFQRIKFFFFFFYFFLSFSKDQAPQHFGKFLTIFQTVKNFSRELGV
jgi:hypothetical protein